MPPDAPSNVQLGSSSYYIQPITIYPYGTTLTGAIISGGSYGYTNLSQSGLTITGLSPGNSYYSLSVQVQNNDGTSNSSTVPNFSTLPLPSPNVTSTSGDYNSLIVTLTIYFDTYPSEINVSYGTLFDSGGNTLGSFDTVSNTSLVITNLSPGYYYSNCHITLYNGMDTTPQSNTFDVSTTPVTGAMQSPYPDSNPITIIFNDVGPFGFNVGSGTIFIPGQGSWSASGYISNTSIQFAPSLSGSYSGCYIILENMSSQASLPSNTFDIQIM